MAKKDCKHTHQCDSCIRDEIKVIDDKMRKLQLERFELQKKLPGNTITYICNHGCLGWCGHRFFNAQSITNVPYVTTIPSGTGTTATWTIGNALNSSSGLNKLQ